MMVAHMLGDKISTIKARILPILQSVYSFFQSAIPDDTTVSGKNIIPGHKIHITPNTIDKIPRTLQSSLLERDGCG